MATARTEDVQIVPSWTPSLPGLEEARPVEPTQPALRLLALASPEDFGGNTVKFLGCELPSPGVRA